MTQAHLATPRLVCSSFAAESHNLNPTLTLWTLEKLRISLSNDIHWQKTFPENLNNHHRRRQCLEHVNARYQAIVDAALSE